MTYQPNCTLPKELLEQIAAEGSEALPGLIRVLIDEAMRLEREQHLGAGPYERTPERRDHANGYKPKTVKTRMGEIQFAVPQVRQGDFYPGALEKGLRSERALTMALAEMYVQGVSTRRVVKPGGIIIIGVMSLLSSLIRFLPGIVDEKKQFGIDATKWLMDTGIQDAEHYPVQNKNYVHMMNVKEFDSLFDGLNIQIIEKRAAGIFSMAGEEALDQAKADKDLWKLILSKELEFSKNPECLGCGANMIYVVKKM